MTRTRGIVVVCGAAWALSLWAVAPALAADPGSEAAPAPRRTVTRPVVQAKVSGIQLFRKLEILNAKLDTLSKQIAAQPSLLRPAAPAAPGASAQTVAETSAGLKSLDEAFYNYAVNHKKAQDLAFAGRLIMDLGIVGGGITMARGWEIGRHHDEARTIQYAWPYYMTFSVGALTTGVSVIVGEMLGWAANRAEASAAQALMAPQANLPDQPLPAEASTPLGAAPAAAPAPKP